MNKYTIIIYALIVGAAVLSSVIKKIRKTNNTNQNKPTTNYNKPANTTYQKPPTTQPKSLEDILQSLLNEQKPQQTYAPQVEDRMVTTDKTEYKSTTLEDETALQEVEKEYYAQDTELGFDNEIEDYDEMTDHHVHGAGFDKIEEVVEVEEDGEWADIDWRKAVISAEILKRPEY